MRRIVVLLASTLVVLLASAKSYAESDQLIVMECTYGNPEIRMTITLDLPAKTAAVTTLFPNAGGSPDPIRDADPNGTVTQISDDQITFVSNQGTINQWTHTLNRYTGNDTVKKGSEWSVDYICHKQQKQF